MTAESDAEFVERIKREWDGDNVPCVEDFDQLIAIARRGAKAAARIEQLEAALREIVAFDWSKDVSDEPSIQDIARAALGEKP